MKEIIISKIKDEFVGICLDYGLFANTIVHKSEEDALRDLASKVTINKYFVKETEYAKIIYDLWYANNLTSNEIIINYSGFSEKEIRVLEKLRSIETPITYKKLSHLCNIERGARFIGNVMKKNRCPLVIPCHRVVRSDKIGNYQYGTFIKKMILERETKK